MVCPPKFVMASISKNNKTKASLKYSMFSSNFLFFLSSSSSIDCVRAILALSSLKCNCLRKSPKKKIDFFRSSSHVDFLKAHIKISYLANFQIFWTLPHWLAGIRRQRMGLKWTFFCI
jgi:hypothetical protein